MSERTRRTAVRPRRSKGWWIVVSGGASQDIVLDPELVIRASSHL